LLSHRAIINFLQSTRKGLQLIKRDVTVSWLPLYHDFGFFAGFLLPLLSEVPTVLISPFKWLSKPRSFLEALQKYKGTVSFLPNSGHNHTVRIVPSGKVNGLDLSSLRALVNGAEPILHKSVDMFFRHFSACGFKASALASGYGMAENTLSATVSIMGQRSPVDWINAEEMQVSRKAVPAPPDKPGSVPYVSSGGPLDGVELKIIDEKRNELPERSCGEITIRSNSLFSGYLNRKDLTEKVLINGWYHTGDLGYMANGQLFVCGRKKDLIIIGGHNIHPEDVENIASSVPGIFPDSVVALGIEDEDLGTQRLVIVCSLEHPVSKNEEQEIERELRRKVFRELEVTVGEVHLVNKRWIVKTQSGKITRSMNRDKYKKFLSNNK
jgi:acyl-CoA synthetase (AMP-forming)/AMP-acid ligase II